MGIRSSIQIFISLLVLVNPLEGIPFFLIALKMTLGDMRGGKPDAGSVDPHPVGTDIAIVPLAMPLLAGPGAVSGAIYRLPPDGPPDRGDRGPAGDGGTARNAPPSRVTRGTRIGTTP